MTYHVACLWLLTGGLAAQAVDAKVLSLIEQLGSPLYREREAAAKALIAIGEPALAPLRAAIRHRDLEVRRRAEKLVDVIELRLYGSKACCLGHTAGIVSTAVSADGKRAISGASDGTVRLWDLDKAQQIRQFRLRDDPKGGERAHAHEVWAVALSHDGRRAASGGNDNLIRIWEIDSGKLIRQFPAIKDYVRCLAFTPDGKLLVSGSYDSLIRIWDVAEGKEVRQLKGHKDMVMCVAVSPDGKRIASGGAQDCRTVRVWEVETGKQVYCMEGHGERIMGIDYAVDGNHVVTGSWDSTARLWDVRTGKLVCTFEGHTQHVYGVAITPDNRHVLTGSADNTLRMWDAVTGKELRRYRGHTGAIADIHITADGVRAVTGSYDHSLRVWVLKK